MPIVSIHMRKGRKPEAMKMLLRKVTDAVAESIGADPAKIRVLIHEVDDSHWSVGGISYEDQENGT